MDRQRWKRLNEILLEVSARNRPIDDLDEIPSWFQGTAEEVSAKAQEVKALFDEAYDNGIINRWIDEHAHRGPSTNWDWTTTAHRQARKLGMTLTDPLGISPLFEYVSNRITTLTEMVRPITTDCLDNDLCGHLSQVYEEHVRYVVSYQGKPVAAIVPLVDLEVLKDIQAEMDAGKWVEWIQKVRQRLGWPAVTFDDKEE